MAKRRRGRLESGEGWVVTRTCERCGAPEDSCRCAPATPSSAAPAAVVRLRLEKRRGKPVTVIEAAGIAPEALARAVRELKSACATGGTVRGSSGELQGDHRERARRHFEQRGLRVKG